ncbi:MAG TPA: TetR/AcrR family transcriptional regulator [Spirochaetota bacterium]|nr:TetR/AcrR family transcriptional regulator [Spirochaetota bacterium]HPI87792.1 TetR/AcrR family transcriptional regulator [Spirochaetota bacterium]HPR47032.1 TetR/AcrR family transcriptional regulator [Spirochaetota bacterium]
MNPIKDNNETRKKIILAAKSEFAERGYEGARMSSIAKKAGVNQALIHYYFATKEQLYIGILHRLFGIDREPEPDEFFNILKTPSEKLYAIIYAMTYIHLSGFDPDFSRIMAIELAQRHKNIREFMSSYFIPKMEVIENIIKDGIDCGEFECENTLLAVLNIFNFIISYPDREHWFDTQWYDRIYGEGYIERFLSFIMRYTFKALRPPGKNVAIPVMPDEAMNKLNEFIQKMIEYRKEGGLHE